MHGMTQAERRRIRGRMGSRLFQRRLLLEDTRELKLGGLVRLCPMRLFKPLLTFGIIARNLDRSRWLMPINAGFASPSISRVFSVVSKVRPLPLSSTATSLMWLRTRAPALTGAMKRTRSMP